MRIFSLITATFVLFSLGACSLLEKDIDATVNADILVNESSSGTNLNYNGSTVLNAEDDEDVADNLDKIKDWSVLEVGYQILFFTGQPGTTFTGNMGFSPSGSNSPEVQVAVSNLNLSAASAYSKLNISSSDLNMLASWLATNRKIKVYWIGTLSNGPSSFTVEATAKLRVKTKLF